MNHKIILGKRIINKIVDDLYVPIGAVLDIPLEKGIMHGMGESSDVWFKLNTEILDPVKRVNDVLTPRRYHFHHLHKKDYTLNDLLMGGI